MKRLLSILLSLVMIFTSALCIPLSAFAGVGEEVAGFVENPYYSGEELYVSKARLAANAEWIDSNAPAYRDSMVDRESYYIFSFNSPRLSKSELEALIVQLLKKATSMQLSVSSVDGDYLLYSVAGLAYVESYSSAGVYSITISTSYYDNAKEERMVTNVINDYLASLNMNSISDYNLLKAFHNYILSSCTYNHADMDNHYNATSYGVFCKGKAVCQGYAVAFYRLCKEVGFDARVVVSDSNEGNHAWNLVHIGDKFYYVDTTWDDSYEDYGYSDRKYTFFLVNYDKLQSEDTVHEHLLEAALYDDDDYFNTRYRSNISSTSWDMNSKSVANCKIITDGFNVTAVYDRNDNLLANNVQYVVTYPNKNSMSIIGKGDYTGTSNRNKSLINCSPVLEYTSTIFNGKAKKPSVYINTLTENVDYKVNYYDNINAGTATVKVTGINGCSGSKQVTFDIQKADINNFNILLSYTSAYYNGSAQCPSVSIDGLRENTDYRVINTPVEIGQGNIVVEGIGNNCYSSKSFTYEILKYNINDKEASLSPSSFVYNGNARKPRVYIPGLIEGVDYDVSYSNNKNCGIGYVTIAGKGYYEGSKVLPFEICPQEIEPDVNNKVGKITLSWDSVSGANGYVVEQYSSGSWKTLKSLSSSSLSYTYSKAQPAVTYKFRVRAFTNAGDSVVYGSGVALDIKAKSPSVSKATITSLKAGKKAITVKWKKLSYTGYEIQYSTNSSFKKASTKTATKASIVSQKIGSLKKGKRYYVRVRAYKTINGKKCYGSWSAKKSVICK